MGNSIFSDWKPATTPQAQPEGPPKPPDLGAPQAGNVEVSVYQPKVDARDKTSMFYWPPVPGKYKSSQVSPLESTPPGPPAEDDMLNWMFGHPFRPQPYKVPGRTDYPSLQNVGQEATQGVHDMAAIGSAAMGHINEALPYMEPGGPIKWVIQHPKEAAALPASVGEIAKDAVLQPAEKYIRPLLHKDAGRNIGLGMAREPAGTALDALVVADPLMGMVSKSARFMAATTAGRKALLAGKLAARNITRKVPELQAYKAIKGILGPMPAETIQKIRKMRSELTTAWGAIDKDDQLHVIEALEGTNPAYEHLLQKPEIQRYREVQDKWHQFYWGELTKRGFVTEADRLVSQVFPRWAAQVDRGVIPGFPKGLSSQEAYDPAILQELQRFEKAEKALDPDAFKGAYNPVTFKGDIKGFNPQAPLIGGNVREKAVAPRQQAAIQKTTVNGEEVIGLRDKSHSFNASLNMARKLELTQRFLSIYEWLENMHRAIDTLPPAARAIAYNQLSNMMGRLLQEVGVSENLVALFQKSAYQGAQLSGRAKKLEELLEKGLKNPKKFIEGYNAFFEPFARWGRALSVLGDFIWPHLLHLQQWLIFGGETPKNPQSVFNAIVASILSRNPKVFQHIPAELLETRNMQKPGHPLLDFFANQAQQGYDAANTVRGAAAIRGMLDEFDKLPQNAKQPVLDMFKRQFNLSVRYNDFRHVVGATQGGARLGRTAQEWESFMGDLEGHLKHAYGHYQGPYNLAMQTFRTTSMWGNMTIHALTQAYDMAVRNPGTLMFARNFAKRVGAEQIMSAKSQDVPDWAVKLGMNPVKVPAPEGYVNVQPDAGMNLLIESIRSARTVPKLFGRIFRDDPHVQADEESDIDAQLNPLFAAGMMFTGRMPTGRNIRNPFHADIYNKKYDILDIAQEYAKGKTPKLEDHEIDMPFDNMWHKLFTIPASAFAQKKFTQLKTLNDMATGTQHSDVTVPNFGLAPGLTYPKVDFKGEKLAPAVPHSLFEFIPGGHRLAFHTIKKATQAQRDFLERPEPPVFKLGPRGMRLTTQKTPEAKAYVLAGQMNRLREKAEKEGKGNIFPK